jgi:acylaminoacyl-peptidase
VQVGDERPAVQLACRVGNGGQTPAVDAIEASGETARENSEEEHRQRGQDGSGDQNIRTGTHVCYNTVFQPTFNDNETRSDPIMRYSALLTLCLSLVLLASFVHAAPPGNTSNDGSVFRPIDVFELENASDPQISPDGKRVVYVRNFADIMNDRRRSNLWIVEFDGTDHRPLTTGIENDGSPRWSPDGTRIAYVSNAGGSRQLYVRWMDTGQTAMITHLTASPGGLAWSPDGEWIAFSMMVPEKLGGFAELPRKPKGARWAEPPKVIEKMIYRSNAAGYLPDAFSHIFVVPVDGGTPRQVTSGPYHHRGTPAWMPDGNSLVFSANRNDDWDREPRESEIYEVSLETGDIRQLTERYGPDNSPAVSRDGKRIAYVGYDDEHMCAQVSRLYVMGRDGGDRRELVPDLDRGISRPVWSGDGKGIYFRYHDQGNTKIGYVSLGGKMQTLAHDMGGTYVSRPYGSGSFSVAPNGRFAYTQSRPDYPADVAAGRKGDAKIRRVTRLNDDLFGYKKLAAVEEIWYESSFDGRSIQGWIVKPPGFDPSKKYPLILEIHGGPHTNYGDRFSVEMQLYAAAGYVVFYANPRSSTSYGEEFIQLVHHNYPGEDYDDLMSGVDAVIAQGYIDEDNLFVTGGSGGGLLSAWIIGKTDRFSAAAVAKPVINWYSFALTADLYNMFYRYWFPGPPWEHAEAYMRRSPLSLVGNVTTPAMVMTGEVDYRTPISESEQYYQALKLEGVDAMLVRVPGASHGIAARPSQQIAKIVYILEWFERYRTE